MCLHELIMREPYSWFQTANCYRKTSPNWTAWKNDYKKFEKRINCSSIWPSLKGRRQCLWLRRKWRKPCSRIIRNSTSEAFPSCELGGCDWDRWWPLCWGTCISTGDKKTKRAGGVRGKENKSYTFDRLLLAFIPDFPLYISLLFQAGNLIPSLSVGFDVPEIQMLELYSAKHLFLMRWDISKRRNLG